MDSPFQDILHTNVAPSDSECQGIRDFLEGPYKRIADLTEELVHLDSLRKELLQKRGDLLHFIDAHRALLSPARQLPEDIVRAIFMACTPSTRDPATSSQETPLLLSQICRSWRSIALATPRLWSAIRINVPNNSRLQQAMNWTVIQIKRSGVVPLDISMVVSQTCEADCDVSALLSSLAAVSRRWKTIEIPLPDNVERFSLSLTAEDVPLLENVKLNQAANSTLPPSRTSLLFLASKSLRRLKIPASPHYQETPVSWKCLTHLEITRSRDRLSCAAALAILRQCTALQTCKFAITETLEANPLTEQISLPQLSHLSVAEHSRSLRHFFGGLTLPNLRLLHYEALRGGSADLTYLFLPTHSLESLVIHMRGLHSDTAMNFLRYLPTLKKLSIWDIQFENEKWFIERLTPSPGRNGAFLSHLQFVEFRGFGQEALDKTLLQFVRSRTELQIEGVARLSQVVVQCCRPMEFDILPHLQGAIAAGLNISLYYPPAPPPRLDDFTYDL